VSRPGFLARWFSIVHRVAQLWRSFGAALAQGRGAGAISLAHSHDRAIEA